MNVLKERRKRRNDRNSGGSAESIESYYGVKNIPDIKSVIVFKNFFFRNITILFYKYK